MHVEVCRVMHDRVPVVEVCRVISVEYSLVCVCVCVCVCGITDTLCAGGNMQSNA